jgi:hypothetical protein
MFNRRSEALHVRESRRLRRAKDADLGLHSGMSPERASCVGPWARADTGAMNEAPPPPPSRSDIEAQLRGLLSGERSRQDVALWAERWVAASDPGVDDEAVWDLLLALVGADMPAPDRSHLYDATDFEAWLEELLDAEAP